MGRMFLTALVAFGMGAWFTTGHTLKINLTMPDPHLPKFEPGYKFDGFNFPQQGTSFWSDQKHDVTMPLESNAAIQTLPHNQQQ
jgi:hypothetical protein